MAANVSRLNRDSPCSRRKCSNVELFVLPRIYRFQDLRRDNSNTCVGNDDTGSGI